MVDKTFSDRDVARIFFNNLTAEEQREARIRICTDPTVENLRAAAVVFRLLKFGPGAFKAIGTAGDLLFTGARKIIEASQGGRLDFLKGGVFGFLIPPTIAIPVPPDLRLKRVSLPGGDSK